MAFNATTPITPDSPLLSKLARQGLLGSVWILLLSTNFHP
jgi:hypothetical protein